MAFTIAAAIEKALAGLEIDRGAALAQAEKLKAEYPDAAAWLEQYEGWLTAQLAPALDPASLAATLHGIAQDILSGMTGADPQAWRGSV